MSARFVNTLFLVIVILGSAFAAGMAVGKHLSSPGNAAPAPSIKTKPAPQYPHIGRWTMVWKGTEYRNTYFNEDRTYRCGKDLRGAWNIEDNGRTLRVHEYTPTAFYNWSIDLRADGISGVLIDHENPSEFKLTPQASDIE
jgi:hypothetical protein